MRRSFVVGRLVQQLLLQYVVDGRPFAVVIPRALKLLIAFVSYFWNAPWRQLRGASRLLKTGASWSTFRGDDRGRQADAQRQRGAELLLDAAAAETIARLVHLLLLFLLEESWYQFVDHDAARELSFAFPRRQNAVRLGLGRLFDLFDRISAQLLDIQGTLLDGHRRG